MDNWNIIFNRGASYSQSIAVQGVADISSATLWRVTFTLDNAVMLTATSANGMLVAGSTTAEKFFAITPTQTAAFPLGNGSFNLDILWGTDVRRYVSNSRFQVNL